MKRIAALVLLISFALVGSMSALPQRVSPKEDARQSRQAAKRQRKMLKRAYKKQQRARRKSEKAQRKAIKRANHHAR